MMFDPLIIKAFRWCSAHFSVDGIIQKRPVVKLVPFDPTPQETVAFGLYQFKTIPDFFYQSLMLLHRFPVKADAPALKLPVGNTNMVGKIITQSIIPFPVAKTPCVPACICITAG